MGPRNLQAAHFVALSVGFMFHDLDDAIDGVLVNLSRVGSHGGVVVAVELMRGVSDVPQALLV